MNMLDITKREHFVKLIDDLNLKTGVEVGVHKGNFSEFLLANSKLEKLYSVDAWSADEELTKSARRRSENEERMEDCEKEARERLSKFDKRSQILKGLSEDVVESFNDESLDFIYLDASHRFTGFGEDMLNWWKKLKWGGIYSGHDYWRRYRYEVSYVVNAFSMEYKQLFYLTTDERDFPIYGPSWWLIKTYRRRRQFGADFEKHKHILVEQRESLLKNKRIMADIPYECYDP